MTGVLVDTNVISELDRPQPNEAIVSFLVDNPDFWLSVVVVHELEFGIRRMQCGTRRTRYEETLHTLSTQYKERILPVDSTEALLAAELQARMERLGQSQTLSDTLIAATAITHDLTIVTRNVRHFRPLGVDLINPWGDG